MRKATLKNCFSMLSVIQRETSSSPLDEAWNASMQFVLIVLSIAQLTVLVFVFKFKMHNQRYPQPAQLRVIRNHCKSLFFNYKPSLDAKQVKFICNHQKHLFGAHGLSDNPCPSARFVHCVITVGYLRASLWSRNRFTVPWRRFPVNCHVPYKRQLS